MKTVALALLGLVSATAANAQGGPRIEARLGWDHQAIDALVTDGDVSYDGKVSSEGFSYGGEIGYDVPLGNVLIGAYAGIDAATTGECATWTSGEEACIKAGRNITAGLRVGARLGAGVLAYVKGGYSSGRVRATYRDPLDATYDFAIGENVDGYHVGGGVQADVGRNLYMKLEYVYTDYSDYDYRDEALGARVRLDRSTIVYGLGYRF